MPCSGNAIFQAAPSTGEVCVSHAFFSGSTFFTRSLREQLFFWQRIHNSLRARTRARARIRVSIRGRAHSCLPYLTLPYLTLQYLTLPYQGAQVGRDRNHQSHPRRVRILHTALNQAQIQGRQSQTRRVGSSREWSNKTMKITKTLKIDQQKHCARG